ncbi:hypothetical protein D047_3300B, partial [Vibrio parahaemolyticus VPTS-2010_2]
ALHDFQYLIEVM